MGAWAVVFHLHLCAADYIELYVQFSICSNLTAGSLIFSRLLRYFIKVIFNCIASNRHVLIYEFIKHNS